MRKPRDFDAELKALEDKAKQLKARKVTQLGELVIATGADALTPDELAGALVALAETKDAARREAWAKRGIAFYAGRSRSGTKGGDSPGKRGDNAHSAAARLAAAPGANPSGTLPLEGAAQPAPGSARAG